MQEYVALHYDIGYPALQQQRVVKRAYLLALVTEHLFRKIHEVTEIMNSATGYQVVALGQVQLADQVFEETRIHFLVVYETHRLSFAAVLQSFLDFLDQRRGNIAVDINFRITRYFKYMRLVMVVTEIRKYFRKIVADHIFQQNDTMLVFIRSRQDNEPP